MSAITGTRPAVPGSFGKPVLRGGQAPNFSLSWRPGVAAIALCDSLPLGIDVEIPTGAAAMEAAATTGIGIGYLSEAAVRSTLRVLRRTAADPFEALRGAVFGAVQGARDTGAQVGQAAAHAVQAARAAATSLGLSEREAADHAARAALEAAEGLDREAQAEVKAAVLDELLGKEKVEPGSKPS